MSWRFRHAFFSHKLTLNRRRGALITTCGLLLLLSGLFLLSNDPPHHTLSAPPAKTSHPMESSRRLLQTPPTFQLTHSTESCRCEHRQFLPTNISDQQSTCVGLASHRSNKQRVISYSFYGDLDSDYFSGIELNLRHQPRFFPDWTVRVYLNFKSEPRRLADKICQLACRYDYVDFCDVSRVPSLGDISTRFGMIWRFLPLGDPSVERFLVRDTDSLLAQRDADAVDEWMSSDKGFHVMRDHPDHGAIMLGGLWGGWNRHMTINRSLRDRMIRKTFSHKKGADQVALATVLAPVIFRHKDVLSHDSYLCHMFPRTRPFPSRRHHPHEVLGTPMNDGVHLRRPCPLACRPADHHDWKYC